MLHSKDSFEIENFVELIQFIAQSIFDCCDKGNRNLNLVGDIVEYSIVDSWHKHIQFIMKFFYK